MGLVVMSAGMSMVLVGPLLWLIFKYIKAPNPQALGLFACGGIWLILTVFVAHGLQLQSTRQGEQVAPADVPMLKVPSNATNICYKLTPLSGVFLRVQFTSDESSFLQWMAAQGHTPVPGDSFGEFAYPVPTKANPQPKLILVKNRFTWNDYLPDDDAGSHIIYDRDTSTVYYISTTR